MKNVLAKLEAMLDGSIRDVKKKITADAYWSRMMDIGAKRFLIVGKRFVYDEHVAELAALDKEIQDSKLPAAAKEILSLAIDVRKRENEQYAQKHPQKPSTATKLQRLASKTQRKAA